MLYVRQSLGPDERLVHIGRFHWYYTLFAILGIVWGIVLAAVVIGASIYVSIKTGMRLGEPFSSHDSLYTMTMKLHPTIKLTAFFMVVMGLLKFVHMMIIRATTEIAVTSSRVIYKHGLIARYVGEISIDRIEGVNVIQSIMGRLLDFGSIIIRGMGIGEVFLPPISNPLKFRRAIEYARSI